MKLSRSTKYNLSLIGLAVLVYLAYRYYGAAKMQPRQGKELTNFILLGCGLFLISAVVIMVQAYYRRQRFDDVGESELASEMKISGAL